jgi:hypothetical protein
MIWGKSVVEITCNKLFINFLYYATNRTGKEVLPTLS